jgi:hypothetical protein
MKWFQSTISQSATLINPPLAGAENNWRKFILLDVSSICALILTSGVRARKVVLNKQDLEHQQRRRRRADGFLDPVFASTNEDQ